MKGWSTLPFLEWFTVFHTEIADLGDRLIPELESELESRSPGMSGPVTTGPSLHSLLPLNGQKHRGREASLTPFPRVQTQTQ